MPPAAKPSSDDADALYVPCFFARDVEVSCPNRVARFDHLPKVCRACEVRLGLDFVRAGDVTCDRCRRPYGAHPLDPNYPGYIHVTCDGTRVKL